MEWNGVEREGKGGNRKRDIRLFVYFVFIRLVVYLLTRLLSYSLIHLFIGDV